MREKDPWKSVPDDKRLDFKVIAEPLATLAEATVNKVEREWPATLRDIAGAPPLFLMLTKVAIAAYETVKYFCAEKPDDPNRKIWFSVSAAPLLRSLVDEVCTVVFLVEDLPKRVEWYFRSGWRETFEEDIALRARYGGQPAWEEWLGNNRQRLAAMQADLRITEAELARPSSIQYWPTPPQMKSSQETAAFLEYLRAWFYRELSQQSHLSYPGLAARGGNCLRKEADPIKEGTWRKMRSDAVGYAVVLLLAFLTEVIVALKFDLRSRAAYLWALLAEYFGVAEELYEARYKALLQ